MIKINIQVRVANKLYKRLEELNISQKELAKMIGEREATVSDFVNIKRTSLNVELLAKIATALKLNSISDLIEFSEILYSDNYTQNKWYELSDSISFAYIYNLNELYFEVAEVTESNVLLHNRYLISNKTKEAINNEFSELDFSEEYEVEDELTFKLILLCRFKGEIVSAHRYKSREDAKETLYMLY